MMSLNHNVQPGTVLKIAFRGLLLSLPLLLFQACIINCEPCPPYFRPLLRFDTSALRGFRINELDTIHIRRYDANGLLIDSLEWRAYKSYANDRQWNIMEADALDRIENFKRKTVQYELQVKGDARIWRINSLLMDYLPQEPGYCNCDGYSVGTVRINDSLYANAQLPYTVYAR